MARVSLLAVSKRYAGSDEMAVDGVSQDVNDGEFFVLLGPSGCGKSTLLKLIAGLEDVTTGEIRLDGQIANYLTPAARNIAMVFQNYALYPHMTVENNIRFPLRMRKVARAQADLLVEAAARMLELEAHLARPVSQLSGGQRQRVALARAVVRQPRVMLMDEPLSNLDALLRVQTREELLKLHKRMPGTVLYVTHDQIEATTMGDRIGIMNAGRLVQVGTPVEVYRRPADVFVAGFVGSPPMALIRGEIRGADGAPVFRSEGVEIAVPSRLILPMRRRLGSTGAMTLGVRVEAARAVAASQGEECTWVVDRIETLGADRMAVLRSGGNVLRARLSDGLQAVEGDNMRVALSEDETHLFDDKGANVLVDPGDAGWEAVPEARSDERADETVKSEPVTRLGRVLFGKRGSL